MVKSYPAFLDDLNEAIEKLIKNNPLSKNTCERLRSEIKDGILRFKTYARFSKWCHWNQKSSEDLARKISLILFGFIMPRIWDQANKLISPEILNNFLNRIKKGENMNGEVKEKSLNLDEFKDKGEDLNDISKLYEEYSSMGRIEFITFHPAYSYEEFVEGVSVRTEEGEAEDSEIKYFIREGLFKRVCKMALAAALGYEKEEAEKMSWRDVFEEYKSNKSMLNLENAPRYILIIDEINRGDIAKIFGELITLLEADKRIGAENEIIVRLPVSNDLFGVPPNLYIIATMNTADRSIALIDVALRRRFGFVEMNPDFDILRKEHLEKNKAELERGNVYNLLDKSIEAIEKINNKICEDVSIGRDRQIGHSYFFKVYTVDDLCLVWKNEILPLLEEYCYSDYKKLNWILFGKEADSEWISEAKGIKDINPDNLLGFLNDLLKG